MVGVLSLGDRAGREKGTRKEAGTERKRGTHRGEGSSLRAHVPTIIRAPRMPLHQAVQCPAPCPGPQASGGEDDFRPSVPGEQFNAE